MIRWRCVCVCFSLYFFLFVVNANSIVWIFSSVYFVTWFAFDFCNLLHVFRLCDSEYAWKKKIYKKNKFCCCRTKHTCNWMLMSTEYSLQSCKEISHCFAQYFSYLDNLFCVNECMCLYKWRCAFEQTETNFFFTYKFIFCTVFFASCNGIFCFVGSLKRKRTWRLPLYMWLFFFRFGCCFACSWYEQRTNCVRQCKVGCC